MAPGDLDFSSLRAVFSDYQAHDATSPEQVAERIAGAEAVIVNKVVLDEHALESAPSLKLVCIAATGTNNVDLVAASRLGITVCNVRAYGTAAVSQHVFALVLALRTRLVDYVDAVRAGRWQRSTQFCFLDFPIHEVVGKTLGIVGYGDLGRGVARIARGFDMEVLLAQRPGRPSQAGRVPLEELLPRVDVLTLHCPLNDATRGLIGREELRAMKSDAVLINAARGGIVDEAALADALRAGEIGGAGMDVLTVEPPSEGNVLLADDIPNLIVTPHVAWGSREARQRILEQVAGNVEAFVAGSPRNVVG